MRPVLGEFLAAAGEHIDAATRWDEPMPYEAACAAVRELARLLTTMAGCANAFLRHDQPQPPAVLELPARADWDARTGLRRAAVRMRVAVSVLDDREENGDYDHPAVAHLTAAADCLAAGHDLLQTHFGLGPFGSRHGTSRWAPVITSTTVNHALTEHMGAYADRLAPWAIRLTGAHPPEGALAPQAWIAVGTACQRLRAAAAASWAASRYQPAIADAHALLRVIPLNAAPPRHSPSTRETLPGLWRGTITTAERLRHLTRSLASRPHQPGTFTAAARQRIAQGAAITGHCSELILRTLTEPGASQLSGAPDAMAALARAADAANRAWSAWRAVAHAWDTFSTGISKTLTPAATEIDDLVLWVGRLAHRDPAWTPARGHTGLLREPASLGGGRDTLTDVVSALYHAADALADIATCEHETAQRAAANHELFVPTRTLSEKYDVPYRYAPAPFPNIVTLLDTYDNTINASRDAATALETLASAVNSPRTSLSALRAVNTHPTPFLPHGDAIPTWLPTRQTRPGQVQRALRDLAISEPAFLTRASDIDTATADLISEATATTRRRPHRVDHRAAPHIARVHRRRSASP